MKILLHFGFPKTMSSSLQFGLFKPLHDRNMVNLKTWRQDDCNEHMDLRPSSRLFNNQEILNPYVDFKDNILNENGNKVVNIYARVEIHKQINNTYTYSSFLAVGRKRPRHDARRA